jgi:hypothetical protein
MSTPRFYSATPGQRGFALIFAVGTVSMLMAGALILLTQAGNYAEIVAASANRQQAAAISDVGVMQARTALFNLIHPLGPSGPQSLTLLRLRPALSDDSPLCADGAKCKDFRSVVTAQTVGKGQFTAAVACFPKDCSIADSDLLGFELRVLSTLPNGVQKLVEVTLMP